MSIMLKKQVDSLLAADEGNTRIIKFNSRGWYKTDETKILSGDFIYVPKKSPKEFREYFTIIATDDWSYC